MTSPKEPTNIAREQQNAKASAYGVPQADLGPGGEPAGASTGAQRSEEEAFEIVSGNENLQEMLDQLRD